MTLIGKAAACRQWGRKGVAGLMGPKGLEVRGGEVPECESEGSGQTPRLRGKEGCPAGPGRPPHPPHPRRTSPLTVRQGAAADWESGSRLALVCPGLPKPPSPPLGGDGAGRQVGAADSFHSRRYNPGW